MKKKIAIAAAVVLVLLIILAVAFFADTMLQPPPKAVSFDDHDLRPSRVEMQVESNGFPVLLQARRVLLFAKDEPLFKAATNWEEGRALEILATNQTSLEMLDRALAYPGLQVELVTNETQDFAYLDDLRRLAQLAIIQAKLLFQHGEEMKAFEKAIGVLHFGQSLQGADGTEIHFYTGAGIKSQGLSCLRELADKTILSASNLLSVSQQLKFFESDPKALREALKVEYLTHEMMINDMAGNYVTNAPIFSDLVFNRRKSNREFGEAIRATMGAVTNCFAIGITNIPVADTNQSFLGRLVRGNMVGSMLNEMTFDTQGTLLKSKCRYNVNIRATRIILALRAYQLVNHHPAAALQDLCPDFLEAVPLDDFDGKPLRYLPAEKKVYSVGADLKDDGGTNSSRSKSGDIVFPFHF